MFTTAEPSKTFASTEGISRTQGETVSKHDIRSDLQAKCKLPASDNAGGKTWFSCLKNSSKSLLRIWQAINKRENKAASFLAAANFVFAFDNDVGFCVTARENLFFLNRCKQKHFTYYKARFNKFIILSLPDVM
jgi:hypothetical protein